MNIKTKTVASEKELNNREILSVLHKESPIPENEKVSQSGLFLKRQELSKILFLDMLYRKVADVQGSIIEFGTRWGQNLVTLTNLRGIHEPYNYGRKIIGFDTFEGFLNLDDKDGSHEIIKEGSFAVTDGYEKYLSELLDCHVKESPLEHIQQTKVIRGDASVELKKYLASHPETLIAFAYFDFDIYQPTKSCLEIVLDVMPKGGILAFDEVTDEHFPGETLAIKEVLNIRNHSLKKNPFGGLQAYIVLE